MLDAANIVPVVIAVLSLLTAISAQRQSAKASKSNNETTLAVSRTDMETEAYGRARTLDTQTIERQGKEIIELRAELDDVNTKCDELVKDNRELQRRIAELELHERKA